MRNVKYKNGQFATEVAISKPQPTFSWDEVEALREAISVARPGPEWFTRAEYQERFSVGNRTAVRQLQKLMEAGKIECVGNNLKYYRVKKEGKCKKRN